MALAVRLLWLLVTVCFARDIEEMEDRHSIPTYDITALEALNDATYAEHATMRRLQLQYVSDSLRNMSELGNAWLQTRSSSLAMQETCNRNHILSLNLRVGRYSTGNT